MFEASEPCSHPRTPSPLRVLRPALSSPSTSGTSLKRAMTTEKTTMTARRKARAGEAVEGGRPRTALAMWR